jgi:Ca2+-binding RTX toxin-like protein
MPNGNPKIVGNPWSEYAFGTPDHDRIDGRAGNDTINGFSGNDTITGGSGSDLFVMDRTYDVWGGGQDVITDYSVSAAGHDGLRFTGWGSMTLGYGTFESGESYTTDLGYTMTITGTSAGGTLIEWNTGDSVELRGVTPDQIHENWIVCV